jgi:excisionase family DNA binding protein
LSECPYTPRTLADRWQCKPDLIYRMIGEGRLSAFKLGGKLLRIPAEAVEAYEAGECLTIESGGSRGSSSLSGRKAENAAAIALARASRKKHESYSESSSITVNASDGTFHSDQA